MRSFEPETAAGSPRHIAPALDAEDGAPDASSVLALASLGSALHLQRLAGNQAVAQLLAAGPSVTTVQREPSGGTAGPTVKHTLTAPKKELGKKDAGYVELTTSVTASVDYEFTLAGAPVAAVPDLAVADGGPPSSSSQDPTPLPSPGGPEVKGTGGANASDDGVTYQAEVGAEFERRAVGLFEGCTPKAKIGGEANADKGKLGIEFSMEGENFEPKFAFNLAEMDEQNGIHFATLEVAADWKIQEWSFVTSDGTLVKITPKATITVAIEPDYARIFQYLLEEGGATVAADAIVAGSLIAGGALAIGGFLLTIGDGDAESTAVENAEIGRKQLVAGFMAGATGAQVTLTDDFQMEGKNRGDQWRRDLQSGQRGNGVPVPPSVIDARSQEHSGDLESGALAVANQIFHDALVQRYWEIHYLQREVPWAEIDTPFMMLMEGQGFGRPLAQEGKNSAGASVLPE